MGSTHTNTHQHTPLGNPSQKWNLALHGVANCAWGEGKYGGITHTHTHTHRIKKRSYGNPRSNGTRTAEGGKLRTHIYHVCSGGALVRVAPRWLCCGGGLGLGLNCEECAGCVLLLRASVLEGVAHVLHAGGGRCGGCALWLRVRVYGGESDAERLYSRGGGYAGGVTAVLRGWAYKVVHPLRFVAAFTSLWRLVRAHLYGWG